MTRLVGLPRSVVNWVGQVAASLGATLAAAALYAALPSHGPSVPRPELTSGGKFAARIASPVAYDGLDTMPSPRVIAIALPAADGPASRRDAPPSVAGAIDRAGRPPRPVRQSARVVPRRVPSPALPEAGRPSAAPAVPEPDTGWVSHPLSTAGEVALRAWALTASTRDAVTDRVLSYLP